MEQGSLRADVNVSVNKPGNEYGTRCEIKNLNSFKFIHAAIVYEAKRQIKLIEQGESVNQETRLFNTQSGETRSMRSKEDAHDYRYFPDPDLLPLILDDDWIEGLKNSIPELPDQKKERLINEYSLSSYDADIIVSDKATSEYFEDVVKSRNPKLVTTWVTSELFSVLNKKNLNIVDSPISSEQLGELIDNIENGKISNRQAKDVFEEMYESGRDAKEIIDQKGLMQISDIGEIEHLVDKVINSNSQNVEKYKNGKDKLFGFFIGEAMKLSKGKANPKILNDLFKKKLSQ
jgi:aspartyl-tRNA(Asn)/glutamyl-tRNA(Gln) amidotransferase subunit B